MSNNSNNIYNILGKLDALKPTPEETRMSLVKEIRESVEAQGSIIEGVDAIQAKLAKQFAKNKSVPDLPIDKKGIEKHYGGSVVKMGQAAKASGFSDSRIRQTGEKFLKGKLKQEDYDREADVKNVAQQYMQANGIQSVQDLGAEDIEYIGQECQCNYAGVCEILGCELPDELGPVQSYDEHGDLEEKAPPGEKAERMVKHIKQGYAKDGKLTDKEKAIAYATTWAAHNKGQVEDAGKVCAECGMTEGSCEHTMAEAEITRTTGKTVHRKTDFPGYPADDLNDPDVEPTDRKRGRPRKHAAKAPTGLGRGRPVKAKAPTFSKQADPFGRISGAVPKGVKGKVHSMSEAMTQLDLNLSQMQLTESRLLDEAGETLQHILNRFRHEVRSFEQGGDLDNDLYDALFDYYSESGEMPYGVQKARTGDPMRWVAEQLEAELGDIAYGKDPANAENAGLEMEAGIPGNVPAEQIPGKEDLLKGKGRSYYEEEVTMEDELNELARLAGLQTTEGNAFTGKLANTPKGGEFELDGKTFKDTSALGDSELEEDDMEEGNEFSGELAKAKATHQKEFEVDGKTYPVKESTNFDGDDSSNFNISTNMSDTGHKEVSVTATGEHAATLLQMLRIAGLGNSQAAHDLENQEPEVEVIAIGEPEAMDEEGVEVDQPAQEPANSPDETYGSIKNITTQGDDLNREKSQDPATANKAANPMTNAQRTLKDVAQLESKLAAEYESIKKISK